MSLFDAVSQEGLATRQDPWRLEASIGIDELGKWAVIAFPSDEDPTANGSNSAKVSAAPTSYPRRRERCSTLTAPDLEGAHIRMSPNGKHGDLRPCAELQLPTGLKVKSLLGEPGSWIESG